MADLKAKSRDKWRKAGYHVENGESYNAHSRRKEDLYGFADLVAVKVGVRTAPWVYIQSTSWGHVPTRLKKIQTETTGRGQWRIEIRKIARAILLRGDRIVVEGWRLNKSNRYECRERELTLEDL
jgi:hypothetical protein